MNFLIFKTIHFPFIRVIHDQFTVNIFDRQPLQGPGPPAILEGGISSPHSSCTASARCTNAMYTAYLRRGKRQASGEALVRKHAMLGDDDVNVEGENCDEIRDEADKWWPKKNKRKCLCLRTASHCGVLCAVQSSVQFISSLLYF